MKKILLFLLLSWAIPTLNAQSIFHKILTQNDVTGSLYRCVQTSDGSYASVGLLTDNAIFDDNFLVAKFNVDGKRLWIKALGSTDSDEFTDVIETSDQGIVAAGSSVNFDSFLSTAVVVKFNSNGTKVWSKKYSLNGLSSTAKKIQKDAGGNLYILGTIESSGSTTDYYIMKLDGNGNILQQTSVNSTFSDYALSFLRKANGDFFIGGWGNNGSGESIHVIKLNASYQVLWNKYIGGSTKLFSYDMKEKSNGNIVLAGRYDNGTNPFNALVLEIENASGNISWAKRYSSSSNLGLYAYGLAIHSDDRIGISGVMEDFYSGLIVFELNPTGTVNWSKRVTSANELSSVGYGICKSFEGGFVVCGSRSGIDSSCVQLLKTTVGGNVQCMGTNLGLEATDVTINSESVAVNTGMTSLVAADVVFAEVSFTNLEDACDPVSLNEELADTELSVYPNPSGGCFIVQWKDIPSTSSLRMFNTSGMLVYQTNTFNNNRLELNLNLLPGIYFLQLNSNGSLLTQKVIIR